MLPGNFTYVKLSARQLCNCVKIQLLLVRLWWMIRQYHDFQVYTQWGHQNR